LDAWSHATGVTITEGGAQAFYRPSVDAVTMPDRYRFKEAEPFYATLFHELTHATGHGTRVGRDFNASKRWGDSAYAMEELVAELGAAFLCSHHGVSKAERADHASYIASWLKVLKSDSRAIFKAAADAQAAVNWLVTRAGGAVETEEVGQALAA
jgi:antirestriction protein ArdC